MDRRDILRGSAAIAATWIGTAFPAAPARAQTSSAQGASTEETRAIAREAYIYGFPLVDNYRIQHSYFVDTGGPEFKTGWNRIFNNTRVYTPDDKAIQTPNSDTPYSYAGADLRAEPLVLGVPRVEAKRYYSLQFIDQYTFNFAYVGSRATGNEAGRFLLAGPGWQGDKPAGITAVIRCETGFAFILYRTQLFGPDDIENVEKIQAGYTVETLSAFLGTPAPAPAAPVAFPKPLSPAAQKTSADVFGELNFILQFCPPPPVETELMASFARIGVGAGRRFDPTPEIRQAIAAGIADAWSEFATYKTTQLDTGKKTSADGFGTREHLNGDYLSRMAGAVLGIYGNSKQEALYPVYFVDAAGQPLDGRRAYRLRFAPDGLPPVHAFWSLTLYRLPESLLFANRLDRYLINSPMLPDLQRDPDGGITLDIRSASPGADRESNWLPAPEGPFFLALRLYWPMAAALDGPWKAPPLEKAS